jgi:hypothetical protein
LAGDADIYYVANRTDRPQVMEARFRVSGKHPEIWHPDTGEIEPASYTVADGRTTVPLELTEREAIFVVFRRAADIPSRRLARKTRAVLGLVDGPWEMSFPPDMGAPSSIRLAELESWTLSADDGVKYFSGTATYTNTFQAPENWFQEGAKILLDLGAVRDVAEVSVNSTPVEILWKPPYQVDVTGVLRNGSNLLQIKVTNQWTNRQIGDRLVPLEKRVLDRGPQIPGRGDRGGGGFGFGGRDQTPAESGLLGPVTVVSVATR